MLLLTSCGHAIRRGLPWCRQWQPAGPAVARARREEIMIPRFARGAPAATRAARASLWFYRLLRGPARFRQQYPAGLAVTRVSRGKVACDIFAERFARSAGM